MGHYLAAEDGMTIYVGCPERLRGKAGNVVVADFYQALLGSDWRRGEAYGDIFLRRSAKLRLGFNESGWSDLRPPRWPDPDYPQQAHLDVLVPDLGEYGTRALDQGGTLLQNGDEHRIFADPAGHPFCLYTDRSARAPVVARLVYDCFSPRALARFYEGFLGPGVRLEDSSERVVVDLDDQDLPNLAFQHARPRDYRHPNRDYPAQLHVDYRFSVDDELPHYRTPEGIAAIERAERLGAIHIPVRAVTYADPAGHPFCF